MYGLTHLDIPSIQTPSSVAMPWGTLISCVDLSLYSLERFDLEKGQVVPLHYYLERRGTYFVEEGDLAIRALLPDGMVRWSRLKAGSTFQIETGVLHALHPMGNTSLYFFTNGGNFRQARFAERKTDCGIPPNLSVFSAGTFDRREKYWGMIESIVSDVFAGKRMVLQQQGQSSLEFHCHKTESYYLQSGKLKVGLRVGRGENTSVILLPGQTFTIMPGLMHMRIALEESVLLEISTADSDQDSHLVEDGKTYQHKE